MIAGLNYNDIKDIANGNVEQNHFTKNLDKNELLEEMANRYIESCSEDFFDDLDIYCDDLYDCITELDNLADKTKNEKIEEISGKIDAIHTKLCELKNIMRWQD